MVTAPLHSGRTLLEPRASRCAPSTRTQVTHILTSLLKAACETHNRTTGTWRGATFGDTITGDRLETDSCLVGILKGSGRAREHPEGLTHH
ncbi:hypothetical protein NHX12_010079 [Muraenolepis orangiensis]|uniref:Uncharacterized protein n=1 Tax=Muraenolepis orangiensis TaxID=630683 RepID=A0A9Q0DKK5_9TELE|nr:hypothetical protein NHX12_010079 [Muraenolepis orangiensis]